MSDSEMGRDMGPGESEARLNFETERKDVRIQD
jgi:hypothetical protein